MLSTTGAAIAKAASATASVTPRDTRISLRSSAATSAGARASPPGARAACTSPLGRRKGRTRSSVTSCEMAISTESAVLMIPATVAAIMREPKTAPAAELW